MDIKKEQKKALKKDGTLKKKYHDMPRYPAITNGIEKKFKEDFSSSVQLMNKMIEQKLKTYVY